MASSNPIYVEAYIQTELERLWQYTQNPQLHQQWDLRFSEITYLPKEAEDDPQRFLYRTRIGFGLAISGEGESAGTKEKDQTRTSFLRFWSDQPISLISQGSGFWRYVPGSERGIRFFTRYDYQTRFGWAGRLLDRFAFRPLMGWATAWSFDALRLWLEKGHHPRLSLQRFLVQSVCWLGLAFMWIYQGLVPKLLYPETGELELLRQTGLFTGYEQGILYLVGIAEISYGLLFLLITGVTGRRRLYIWNVVFLVGLALGALAQPSLFVAPFNPVTLSFGMILLSMIGLWTVTDLPSASNCARKPRKEGEVDL